MTALALPFASPETADAPAEGASARWRAKVAHGLARRLAKAPFAMRAPGPLVSFTFDDVPDSALTAGAPLLEEAGAAGTFYVSGGLLGRRAAAWRVIDAEGVRELHRRGHEVGCHTFSHVPAYRLGTAALRDDLARNRDCLLKVEPGLRLENFAFPYGRGTPGAKRLLGPRFASVRGIAPALNAGEIDLRLLGAYPLVDGAMDRAAVDRVLDEAATRSGWAIFYTHDVAPAPSRFGCTPGLLAHALEGALRRGIAPATVARALALIGHRRT